MKKLLAWATALLTLTFVVSPALTAPFTGYTTEQLPYAIPQPPIQPAGYAFAIWGLIYGWLIVSAVYGVLKRAEDDGWHQTRIPLAVSLAFGTPWLAIANTDAILATITIFIMAGAAILALLRSPQADRWWLRIPVGIYAGWLTAASFVSLGATLPGLGLMDWDVSAFAFIFAALWIAVMVQWRRSDTPAYGLTVVWALAGIIVANLGSNLSIAMIAGVGITILSFVILFRPATRDVVI